GVGGRRRTLRRDPDPFILSAQGRLRGTRPGKRVGSGAAAVAERPAVRVCGLGRGRRGPPGAAPVTPAARPAQEAAGKMNGHRSPEDPMVTQKVCFTLLLAVCWGLLDLVPCCRAQTELPPGPFPPIPKRYDVDMFGVTFWHIAWSPDGKVIALTHDLTPAIELY